MEGKCEALQVLDCLDQNSSLRKSFPASSLEYNMTHLLDHKTGCGKCADDSSSVMRWAEKDFYCTQSPTVAEKSFQSNSSIFEENCVLYSNVYDAAGQRYICDECNSATVIDRIGNCLEITEELVNCELADSFMNCARCLTGYVLVDNRCVRKDIENCVAYVENPASEELTCAQCEEGYGLKDQLCIRDIFTPCRVYGQEGVCEECQPGYHLTSLSNDKIVCINITTHNNCQSYDVGAFEEFKIKCSVCNDSSKYIFQEINESEAKNVCNPLITIKNCVKYDMAETFQQSTLDCTECAPGYYLEGKECRLREFIIDHCTQYEVSSKECISCAETFFLSDDRLKCIADLKGITNCRVYLSNTECQECNSGYRLSGGECVIVSQENSVPNCFTYSEDQVCTRCKNGFLMTQDNLCESIVAQNCLTVTDARTCGSCSFGYQLETLNDVVSCQLIQKDNIVNCAVVSDASPFTCLKCNSPYYPVGNLCVKVEKTIPGCVDYQSEGVCKECQAFYILSLDQSTCVKQVGTKCSLLEEKEQPFCAICKPGYKLQAGSCVPQSQDYSLEENCLIFDSSVVNGRLGCNLCVPGYSMLNQGSCSKNPDANVGEGTNKPTTEPETPDVTTGFRILQTLQSLLFIGLWLLW
jgi:hypothetical protein